MPPHTARPSPRPPHPTPTLLTRRPASVCPAAAPRVRASPRWLRAWVLRGELHDLAGNEFFIEQRAVPNERLWAERYALRDEMLPGFIAKPLAAQALLVGKAINFIRLAATTRSGPSPTTRAAASGAAVDSLGRLEYGQEEQLQVFVSERGGARERPPGAAWCVGSTCCASTARTSSTSYCWGRATSSSTLWSTWGPQLSRPTSHLHRHRLLSLLETAVRSCFASEGGGGGAASDHVLHHLDIQLLDDPGSSGWDAFSLDYRVEPPVSVALSADAMVQYRQVFTLLWRLKRVEHSLTALWQKHGTTAHLLRGLRADPLMHACHTLRHEMIHFVYNLQYYLMFEVRARARWGVTPTPQISHAPTPIHLYRCSSARGTRCKRASRRRRRPRRGDRRARRLPAGPREQVLVARSRTRRSSVRARSPSASLRPPSLTAASFGPSPPGALSQIFEAILSFCKAQDELYLALLEHKAAARQHAAAVQEQTAAGRWGCEGSLDAAGRLGSGARVGAAADGVADVPPRARRVGVAVPPALRRLLPPAHRARGARARLPLVPP